MTPLSPFLKWIDLAVAGVLCLIFAVASPGSPSVLPFLGYGMVWLSLGWKVRLPAVLMVILLGVASRSSHAQALRGGDLWLLGSAALVWAASLWIPTRFRFAGWGIGAVWGLLLWMEPALWLTALCILPQLAIVNASRERSVSWSAIVSGGGVMIWAMISGRTEGLFLRPGEAETYEAVLAMIQTLFAVESILLVIGIAGLFELAQPPGERTKWDWRNLALVGLPAALFFMEPDRVASLSLWVGYPAAAFMLTRWTLALPNLATRLCMWSGFVLLLGVTS